MRTAFSDAEWHNTQTGHDVAVFVDVDTRNSEQWSLTDDGWERV